uniref:Uncharacterized protein n=1 Tax=Cannabis sativa TaxID=3483 RepID=A0A803R113_CANSA
MEKTKGNGIGCAKAEQMVSVSSRRRPPPPPPLPMFLWAKKTNPESVTKQEIAMFWRQKRIEEEDHLLAAIKTAAHIRARNLSVRFFLKEQTYLFILKLIKTIKLSLYYGFYNNLIQWCVGRRLQMV